MALTAKQRSALPPDAYVYPPGTPTGGRKGKYPVPTRKQAAKARIPEGQRQATLRSALSRSAQKGTAGTYATVSAKVASRAGKGGVTPSKGKAATGKSASKGGGKGKGGR